MNKLPDNVTPDFYLQQNIKEAKEVAYDLYGSSSDFAKKLQKKLDNCKTIAEVDNTLIWGRVNSP